MTVESDEAFAEFEKQLNDDIKSGRLKLPPIDPPVFAVRHGEFLVQVNCIEHGSHDRHTLSIEQHVLGVDRPINQVYVRYDGDILDLAAAVAAAAEVVRCRNYFGSAVDLDGWLRRWGVRPMSEAEREAL